MTLYSLALELTLILATWLAIGAWQRDRNVPGRITYAAASVSVMLWVAGALQRRFWAGGEGRKSRLEMIARHVELRAEEEGEATPDS